MPVANRPCLAWLFGELVRFGVTSAVVLTGPVAPDVEHALRALAAAPPRPLALTVTQAPAGAGSAAALRLARPVLDDRFLLCRAATLFDANLARLLADAARDGPDVLARTLRVAGAPCVTLLRRQALDEPPPGASLTRDVMPRLLARGAHRGTATGGALFDLRTPAGRARAEAGLPRRRPALFLDRDGVLNVDHGWVGTRERWEWTPTAQAAVAEATARGWHVFVVTNQSGLARGHYDEAALRALHAWMEDELHAAGGTVDDWRFAPHHPDATVDAYRHPAHPWRKPAPGMILDLIARWDLDPARCVLIGDQPSDLAAAAAAAVRGVHFPGGDLHATVVQALTP